MSIYYYMIWWTPYYIAPFLWLSIRPMYNLMSVYVSIYTMTLRLHLIFCIALGTPWHLLCNPHHSPELLHSSYHRGCIIKTECHHWHMVVRAPSTERRWQKLAIWYAELHLSKSSSSCIIFTGATYITDAQINYSYKIISSIAGVTVWKCIIL